ISGDLISRYSCDRYCPQLPKFVTMGLMGKKSKQKKKFSKSRERAEKLKNTTHEKYDIYSEDGLKLVRHYFFEGQCRKNNYCNSRLAFNMEL
ncbi:MAG: hypothetical protein K2H13_02115, partial [Eubacterium sp.]|nr:hypothetical protein [Eubacterium sp.]